MAMYRKRNKRAPRRKPRRFRSRGRKNYRKKNVVVRGVKGFPLSMFTRLNYSERFPATIDPFGVRLEYFQTSLFDPRATTGGHQPLWYDQYGTIYQKYRVFGMRYKITVMHISGGTNEPLRFDVQWRDQATMDTNSETAAERSFNKNAWIIPGTKPTVLTGYMSLAKYFGVGKSVISNDDKYSAPISGNPPIMLYCCLAASNLTGSNQVALMDVKMTYYVKFYDKVIPLQS